MSDRLPEHVRRDLQRARRLEWWTLIWMSSVVVVMWLVMGSSQAMKTALIEDVLSLVPAIVFLVALHFELFTSARRTPEIQAELAALHRRIREHVAEQLEAKAREGVIAPTADAESVVTVLLSLADGLALRMLADPEHDWGPTISAALPAARALLG